MVIDSTDEVANVTCELIPALPVYSHNKYSDATSESGRPVMSADNNTSPTDIDTCGIPWKEPLIETNSPEPNDSPPPPHCAIGPE